MNQHIIGPPHHESQKIFYIFSRIREEIHVRSLTSRILSTESQIVVLSYPMFFHSKSRVVLVTHG
jgi:hypothetical protein